MPLDSITKPRHTTLDDIVKCKYEKEKRELMEKNVKILAFFMAIFCAFLYIGYILGHW